MMTRTVASAVKAESSKRISQRLADPLLVSRHTHRGTCLETLPRITTSDGQDVRVRPCFAASMLLPASGDSVGWLAEG